MHPLFRKFERAARKATSETVDLILGDKDVIPRIRPETAARMARRHVARTRWEAGQKAPAKPSAKPAAKAAPAKPAGAAAPARPPTKPPAPPAMTRPAAAKPDGADKPTAPTKEATKEAAKGTD
jgi:hypothetical protein